MADLSPRDERLALIREKQDNAAVLLMRVNHDSLKELIRMASRELDEAIRWLAKADVDSNPSILKIVDCIASLTTCRLTIVDDALKTRGPDAKLIE
jgi:hypothetical protein